MGLAGLRMMTENIRQIHGLTALLRWEGLGVIPQEQVPYPFLQVQKVGSAW